MSNHIPVMVCPVLNKPELLLKMLRSVDVPVGRLYVIDNGGWSHAPGMDTELSAALPSAKRIHVANLGFNIGVGAAWNLGIRANIDAPWWVFMNNDMVLEPGAMGRLAEHMNAQPNGLDDTPVVAGVEMGNEPWGNHFGAHALNAAAVQQLGWFDENFHPIYFEDTDYKARMEVAGVEFKLIRSKTHHEGNQSWKGGASAKNAKSNARSWGPNAAYYTEKWLEGKEGNPLSPAPWGVEPVYFWEPPSLRRLREQAWDLPEHNNVL